MKRILVVEDEDVIRKAVQRLLERHKYSVTAVGTAQEAIEQQLSSFNLILADLRLPGAEGTDLIAQAGPVPVLIMTSHASVRSAVQSMKLGAADYISKPFDHDELLLMVERSLHRNRLYAQNNAMKRDLHRIFPHDEVISNSPAMKKIISKLTSLDDSQRHVLLHGERGTGKELLARISHNTGERKEMQSVFADLPIYEPAELEQTLIGVERQGQNDSDQTQRTGLLQEANGGTLIIRNIDLLQLDAQQRLASMLSDNNQEAPRGLRQGAIATRTQSLNVRVIALIMQEPSVAIANNLLDPDLATLFDNHTFQVPPLRCRREDLHMMAVHYLTIFVRRYRKRKVRLSKQAVHAIEAYDWPGNVTELKSAMERGALLCDSDEITPTHIGLGMADELAVRSVKNSAADHNSGKHTVAATTLSSQALNLDGYFRYVVLQHQNSLSETELAARLGISRKALWERRQKMHLPRPQPKN